MWEEYIHVEIVDVFLGCAGDLDHADKGENIRILILFSLIISLYKTIIIALLDRDKKIPYWNRTKWSSHTDRG